MAVNFPDNPVINQSFSAGGNTWYWTGVYWRLMPVSVVWGMIPGNINNQTDLINLITSSSQNIYTNNGTLLGNRTVTLGGNSLTFAGTSNVTIAASGKVGIGMSPGTYVASIYGTSNVLYVQGTGSGTYFAVYNSNTTPAPLFRVQNTGAILAETAGFENVVGNNYFNSSSGSTLIGYSSGTSTSYKLDVSGSVRLSGTTQPLTILGTFANKEGILFSTDIGAAGSIRFTDYYAAKTGNSPALEIYGTNSSGNFNSVPAISIVNTDIRIGGILTYKTLKGSSASSVVSFSNNAFAYTNSFSSSQSVINKNGSVATLNVLAYNIGASASSFPSTVAAMYGHSDDLVDRYFYYGGYTQFGTDFSALPTNPTALVDILASTTARASLRIRSGAAPTTPNAGDIWSNGTDLFAYVGGVTKNITSPTGVGTITGSGTAGQVTFWSGTSAVTGSGNLYWDNTNSRLGIGTNSPSKTLVISKNFAADDGIAMSDIGGGYFQVTNSSGTGFQPIFQGQARGNLTSLVFKGIQTTTVSPTATVMRFIVRANDDASSITGVNSFTFENGANVIAGFSANNNLLINTTTDSGYRLDINGTGASAGAFRVIGGASSFGADVTINANNSTNTLTSQNATSSTIFLGNASGSNTVAFELQNQSARRFRILSTSTSTTFESSNQTAGFVFNKNAVFSGSITASAAYAYGVGISNTLVASANNDVLVGLDVNPTFTNGAFTGVGNIGVRSTSLLLGTTLLSTNIAAFPLQVNLTNAGNNVGAIWRNTSTTGYTSFRFYNDQNNGSRALEMGYSGSSYATTIITSGITGESGYFTTTGSYPLHLGTNNTARVIISGAGNVLIGTNTEGSYKLDVSGNARAYVASNAGSNPTFVVETINGDSSILQVKNNEGSFRLVTNNGTSDITNTTTAISMQAGVVGVRIADGSGGSGSDNAMLLVSGTKAASNSFSRGININTILTAAANNDTLIGLDVAPTFTNGTFTGVSNIALRVTGDVTFSNNLSVTSAVFVNNAASWGAGSRLSVNGSIGGQDLYLGYNSANGYIYNQNGSAYKISLGINGANTQNYIGIAKNSSATNARVEIGGSITASTALGVGTSMAQTIVAAANNDVLVGLDIAPTFTNGAFTGVSNLALRVIGDMTFGSSTVNPTINFAASANASTVNFIINNAPFNGTLLSFRNSADSRYVRITGSNFDISTTGSINAGSSLNAGSISISSTTISGFNQAAIVMSGDTMSITNRNTATSTMTITSGGDILFQNRPSATAITIAKFAQTTGNFIIQNGGTFTDANYRLDVNGSGASAGALRVTGGNVQFGTQFLWDNTNHKLILGSNTATAGNQIYFNYSSTYGGDFTSQLAGVEQLSFGFNNLNSFGGGSTGVNSGRTLYFYDRIGTAYFGGYSAINGWYFGQSSTRFGLRIENPNNTVTAMTVKSDGKIGINQNTPTATFDLPASTASTSSLRIRSGTAPTTPNDGDVWYDGTDFYGRVGSTTKSFTATGTGGVTVSTYTPTVTGVTNVASVSVDHTTGYYVNYNSNAYEVWGQITMTPSTAPSITAFRLTLPAACGGFYGEVLSGSFVSSDSVPGRIYLDTTNDAAFFEFTPQTSASRTFSFRFIYKVVPL
jgi:hypothetical protein